MTTPPNAPEVDVLSWIDEQVRLFFTGGHPNSIRAANRKRADAARTTVESMLTREAALVAERDAALRSANIAEARVKGWEATVVITNLPSRIWPVEGWGPGEGETVAVPELTPKKLTDILDRLKAADAIADQRDALAAEVGALRLDAERYRFIRNPSHSTIPAVWISGKGNVHIESEWLTEEFADAAIDAARAEPGT